MPVASVHRVGVGVAQGRSWHGHQHRRLAQRQPWRQERGGRYHAHRALHCGAGSVAFGKHEHHLAAQCLVFLFRRVEAAGVRLKAVLHGAAQQLLGLQRLRQSHLQVRDLLPILEPTSASGRLRLLDDAAPCFAEKRVLNVLDAVRRGLQVRLQSNGFLGVCVAAPHKRRLLLLEGGFPLGRLGAFLFEGADALLHLRLEVAPLRFGFGVFFLAGRQVRGQTLRCFVGHCEFFIQLRDVLNELLRLCLERNHGALELRLCRQQLLLQTPLCLLERCNRLLRNLNRVVALKDRLLQPLRLRAQLLVRTVSRRQLVLHAAQLCVQRHCLLPRLSLRRRQFLRLQHQLGHPGGLVLELLLERLVLLRQLPDLVACLLHLLPHRLRLRFRLPQGVLELRLVCTVSLDRLFQLLHLLLQPRHRRLADLRRRRPVRLCGDPRRLRRHLVRRRLLLLRRQLALRLDQRRLQRRRLLVLRRTLRLQRLHALLQLRHACPQHAQLLLRRPQLLRRLLRLLLQRRLRLLQRRDVLLKGSPRLCVHRDEPLLLRRPRRLLLLQVRVARLQLLLVVSRQHSKPLGVDAALLCGDRLRLPPHGLLHHAQLRVAAAGRQPRVVRLHARRRQRVAGLRQLAAAAVQLRRQRRRLAFAGLQRLRLLAAPVLQQGSPSADASVARQRSPPQLLHLGLQHPDHLLPLRDRRPQRVVLARRAVPRKLQLRLQRRRAVACLQQLHAEHLLRPRVRLRRAELRRQRPHRSLQLRKQRVAAAAGAAGGRTLLQLAAQLGDVVALRLQQRRRLGLHSRHTRVRLAPPRRQLLLVPRRRLAPRALHVFDVAPAALDERRRVRREAAAAAGVARHPAASQGVEHAAILRQLVRHLPLALRLQPRKRRLQQLHAVDNHLVRGCADAAAGTARRAVCTAAVHERIEVQLRQRRVLLLQLLHTVVRHRQRGRGCHGLLRAVACRRHAACGRVREHRRRRDRRCGRERQLVRRRQRAVRRRLTPRLRAPVLLCGGVHRAQRGRCHHVRQRDGAALDQPRLPGRGLRHGAPRLEQRRQRRRRHPLRVHRTLASRGGQVRLCHVLLHNRTVQQHARRAAFFEGRHGVQRLRLLKDARGCCLARAQQQKRATPCVLQERPHRRCTRPIAELCFVQRAAQAAHRFVEACDGGRQAGVRPRLLRQRLLYQRYPQVGAGRRRAQRVQRRALAPRHEVVDDHRVRKPHRCGAAAGAEAALVLGHQTRCVATQQQQRQPPPVGAQAGHGKSVHAVGRRLQRARGCGAACLHGRIAQAQPLRRVGTADFAAGVGREGKVDEAELHLRGDAQQSRTVVVAHLCEGCGREHGGTLRGHHRGACSLDEGTGVGTHIFPEQHVWSSPRLPCDRQRCALCGAMKYRYCSFY
eukprot:Rhum_TRINITY_DN7445_c0_g1::Rhum_TRINITY_DN7445_c0_g1_i1::g.23017::m.23017